MWCFFAYLLMIDYFLKPGPHLTSWRWVIWLLVSSLSLLVAMENECIFWIGLKPNGTTNYISTTYRAWQNKYQTMLVKTDFHKWPFSTDILHVTTYPGSYSIYLSLKFQHTKIQFLGIKFEEWPSFVKLWTWGLELCQATREGVPNNQPLRLWLRCRGVGWGDPRFDMHQK